MTKAFDKVFHSKLLLDVSKLYIGGNILKWFNSYLTNRVKITKVNYAFSGYSNASSGIAQGSIIGSLLF